MRTTSLAVAALTTVLFGAAPAAPLPQADATSRSALERDASGWIDLLAEAGPELKGWTRVPIPPPPKGRLDPTPPSQWSYDPKTGVLTCRGDRGHEWLRWDREVGDGVYHVEWRFVPVEGKKGYNSGIYARNSADGAVWHQAQTGSASGGFLFGETPGPGGKLHRINLSKSVTGRPVKPAGEWNTFEITCAGPKLSLWVNGATTCTFDACEQAKGYLGLESEGWAIEFRNVKVKLAGK